MTSPFYFILGGLVLLGILGIFALPAVSDIPPTPAIKDLKFNENWYNATNYRSNVIIEYPPLFNDTGRPECSDSLTGRIIFNTDDENLNICNGLTWILPDGLET